MSKYVNLVAFAILFLSMLGCEKQGEAASSPFRPPVKQTLKDFQSFGDLRCELLAPGKSTSILQFVRLKDSYPTGFGDFIDMKASLFLSALARLWHIYFGYTQNIWKMVEFFGELESPCKRQLGRSQIQATCK